MLSKKQQVDFVLHISTLIHINDSLIDPETFEDIIKSFVLAEQSEKSLDWDAFLTILLDFAIFTFPLQSLTMSHLFDTIAEFEPVKHTSQIIFFYFMQFTPSISGMAVRYCF
jgi:hypothetical protein